MGWSDSSRENRFRRCRPALALVCLQYLQLQGPLTSLPAPFAHPPNYSLTATRHHVEFLSGLLEKEGMETSYVHGNLDQVCLLFGTGLESSRLGSDGGGLARPPRSLAGLTFALCTLHVCLPTTGGP